MALLSCVCCFLLRLVLTQHQSLYDRCTGQMVQREKRKRHLCTLLRRVRNIFPKKTLMWWPRPLLRCYITWSFLCWILVQSLFNHGWDQIHKTPELSGKSASTLIQLVFSWEEEMREWMPDAQPKTTQIPTCQKFFFTRIESKWTILMTIPLLFSINSCWFC